MSIEPPQPENSSRALYYFLSIFGGLQSLARYIGPPVGTDPISTEAFHLHQGFPIGAQGLLSVLGPPFGTQGRQGCSVCAGDVLSVQRFPACVWKR